ncbi:hypothetical protein [Clostridium sp.]|uniref:hypothetical protein n=1 Tax=Clostridium sp. TaxID=1506 RepID=UPI003993DAC7
MAKYKVGDKLIIINDPTKEQEELKNISKLTINDNLATLSWGIKIIDIQYDEPNVTLTYKNVNNDINKVFAVCTDIKNFDHQKVLEKALLKAFQQEINHLTVLKNFKKDYTK